jgi:hypothetical protein
MDMRLNGGAAVRIAVCAAMALIAGGAILEETPARAAASSAMGSPVTLICTISGPAKNRAAITDEVVCARFSVRIREALKSPIVRAGQVPEGAGARWVRLEIALKPLGRVEAVLTSRLHGKATNYPLLAVQVMDKPMSLDDIDRLARLAGRTLASDH